MSGRSLCSQDNWLTLSKHYVSKNTQGQCAAVHWADSESKMASRLSHILSSFWAYRLTLLSVPDFAPTSDVLPQRVKSPSHKFSPTSCLLIHLELDYCTSNVTANPARDDSQPFNTCLGEGPPGAASPGPHISPLLLERPSVPQPSWAPVRPGCQLDSRRSTNIVFSLVAAYDLGAPPALLKAIYDDTIPTLRPVDRQGEDITEGNWTTRLGDRR
jgi:hypothetical protein